MTAVDGLKRSPIESKLAACLFQCASPVFQCRITRYDVGAKLDRTRIQCPPCSNHYGQGCDGQWNVVLPVGKYKNSYVVYLWILFCHGCDNHCVSFHYAQVCRLYVLVHDVVVSSKHDVARAQCSPRRHATNAKYKTVWARRHELECFVPQLGYDFYVIVAHFVRNVCSVRGGLNAPLVQNGLANFCCSRLL